MSPSRSTLALAVLALAAATLAGCIRAPGSNVAPASTAADALVATFTPEAPKVDWSKIVDPDHGAHSVPDVHTMGGGLKQVGHTGVGDVLPPGTHGSITSIDVWDHYAVVPGMEGGLGFVIVDVKDPKAPKPVSYYPSQADGWTARFSKDGNYVFYGCQALGPPFGVETGPFGNVIGNCRDPAAPHAPGDNPAGIVAVDVSDKAKPKAVAFLPASGSHNLQVESINGTDYVFTRAVEIIKFDRAAKKLEIVAKVPGVHDATVHRHPITRDWLLYTGASGNSFAIYNVNDPASPQPVYEGGLAGVVGWHEQTPIPVLVEGRALLAVGGETGVNPKGGVPDTLFIVDITDPAHPTKVGSWVPPFTGALPWASYTFSLHEIAADSHGQLAVAWYHGGVWLLDVSTLAHAAKPVILGAFQPHEEINVLPSTFSQTPVPLVPFVWGVGWDARGYLLVPDMHTGVYVLEPEYGLKETLPGGN